MNRILAIGSGGITMGLIERMVELGYTVKHLEAPALPTQPVVFEIDSMTDLTKHIKELERIHRAPKIPLQYAEERELPYGKRARRQRRGGKY